MRFATQSLCVLSLSVALAACAASDAAHRAFPGQAMAAHVPSDKPLTRHEAALMCWMRYEKGRATLSLDKRADLVDRCVKAEMKRSAMQ